MPFEKGVDTPRKSLNLTMCTHFSSDLGKMTDMTVMTFDQYVTLSYISVRGIFSIVAFGEKKEGRRGHRLWR